MMTASAAAYRATCVHYNATMHAVFLSPISSVLSFKEISLNNGNLDLLKEIFKEMDFLRKF